MPSPDAGPAVRLAGIDKSYDGRPVIRDLDLAVAPGEFLGVLGPSGSGKTTMMRIIGGFEAPDSGTVEIAGQDVTALPPEKRRVNTVFQSYALFPHMSVIDNVAFGPRMRGIGRAERYRKAGELLELVHLSEAARQMPGQLSGGMQQRVALARALANDPAVLLLDEPLGALDRKLREELQRELRRVQHALGATFIYVTHDQEEAFGMADRLAVMRAGRFEQLGDPGTIYDAPASAWVALFVGAANSFAATLGPDGRLNTALGPLAAGFVAAGVKPDDPVRVILRPEATHFLAGAETGTNRIAARLIDRVALGPALRLRAMTDAGIEFESLAGRGGPAATLSAGDPVTIAFDAASLRAYPEDADAASLPSTKGSTP